MNLLNYRKILLIIGFFIFFTNIAFAANLQDAFRDVLDDNDDISPLDKAAVKSGYYIGTGVNEITGTVVNVVMSLLGVIFLSLIIYGGYLWMTAGGNEEKVTKGRNLIIAAIIGLIIVVSAYAISYFVISKAGEGVLRR